MFATPTGSYLPAPTIAGGKKKTDKTHPCPYACTDSDGEIRKFSCPHNVHQHVREKHTLERPYKCQVCGPSHRGFNRPFTLNRHMMMQHGIQTGPGKGNAPRRTKQSRHATQVPGVQPLNQPEFDFNDYQPQPTFAAQDAASDNFASAQAQCNHCVNSFNTLEEMLYHQHTDHGVQPSPSCICMTCATIYSSNAGNAARLEGQPIAGGFGVTGAPQGPIAGGEPFLFNQKPGYAPSALPMQAEEGLNDFFVEDLFPPQPVGDGSNMPNMQQNQASAVPGLQGDYDFNGNGAGTCGGAEGYGGAKANGDDFELDGMDFDSSFPADLGYLNNMEEFEMTEAFGGGGDNTDGVEHGKGPNESSLFSFSKTNATAAEDIYSQL